MRRFAACGIAVTSVDLAVLVGLRAGVGLPVIVADAVAIAMAALTSFLLNRVVTFGDDPQRRWAREPLTFGVVTLVGAAVDIGVLRGAVAALGDEWAVRTLLLGKGLSLTVAAAVRLVGYRRTLFRQVRAEQRAPRAPRGTRADASGDRPRLSVVVPAYRERDRIGTTVARLRSDLAHIERRTVAGTGRGRQAVEIVVVDDGSGDGTAEAARAAGADVVVVQARNLGKGAAVRAGFLAASGATVAFTDADLAYEPIQLARLLEQVEAGWDVVVGSRHHVGSQTLVKAGRLRELTSRIFNVLTSLVLLGQYRDTQCGIKAFAAEPARLVFSHTRLDGFAFDVEVLHLAERYHLSLTEVPVEVEHSVTSTVRVGLDAARMVRDLLRVRRWAGRGLYDLGDETELAGADGKAFGAGR